MVMLVFRVFLMQCLYIAVGILLLCPWSHHLFGRVTKRCAVLKRLQFHHMDKQPDLGNCGAQWFSESIWILRNEKKDGWLSFTDGNIKMQVQTKKGPKTAGSKPTNLESIGWNTTLHPKNLYQVAAWQNQSARWQASGFSMAKASSTSVMQARCCSPHPMSYIQVLHSLTEFWGETGSCRFDTVDHMPSEIMLNIYHHQHGLKEVRTFASGPFTSMLESRMVAGWFFWRKNSPQQRRLRQQQQQQQTTTPFWLLSPAKAYKFTWRMLSFLRTAQFFGVLWQDAVDTRHPYAVEWWFCPRLALEVPRENHSWKRCWQCKSNICILIF